MTTNVKLKEAFQVESKFGAFYTGGNVEWHQDTLFCQTQSNVSLLSTLDGKVSRVIGDETNEDGDFLQTFTCDTTRIVSAHKSGLLKLWDHNGHLLKMWKSIHKGPIAKLALKNDILASGGSDGSIRMWQLDHQSCLANLRGCSGVVSVVTYHPTHDVIFGSGDDGKITSWNLTNFQTAIEYNAHFSKVTSLVFANDAKHFVTSGRDKVIILWQFEQMKALKTIPVHESIVIINLPPKFKLPGFKSDPDVIYVASAGEFGLVKVWDVINAKEIYQQSDSLVSKTEEGTLAVTNLLLNDKSLAIVTADHNIIVHNLKSFVCIKQFIGFSDEILDICYVGNNDTHIAVATNSADIKLYDSLMNCQLLKSHSDIVLTITTSRTNRNLMLSGSKDHEICLWSFDSTSMSCISRVKRHTGAVGTLKFSNTNTNFFVSGSQDNFIKLWQLNDTQMTCVKTEVAHKKDINCVAVSPNDRIIATASQDKTVKLWTDSLTFVGTLTGHKRGVWTVKFSPVDQVIATASADCCIKLWSVTDLNCLKTFEGHDSSVLQLSFISNGMQLLSAGADGLIKLFTIKTSECCGTFDSHQGRVWALAVKTDETEMITGGADSLLIKWKDVTQELKTDRQKAEEEEALQSQKLSNYLQKNNYLKALKLALKLNRPFQVLKIVQGIIKKGETNKLAEAVVELKEEQKAELLRCATNWNTNSRNCQAAQLVMNVLIGELQRGDFRPTGLAASVEGALPYTQRHFNRLTQLLQDLNFITYTIDCMQPHLRKI